MLLFYYCYYHINGEIKIYNKSRLECMHAASHCISSVVIADAKYSEQHSITSTN